MGIYYLHTQTMGHAHILSKVLSKYPRVRKLRQFNLRPLRLTLTISILHLCQWSECYLVDDLLRVFKERRVGVKLWLDRGKCRQ